jgi:hypothetical protein
MAETETIDWTKAHSVELEWNDGHVPASFLSVSKCSSTAAAVAVPQQYLRLYPEYHCPEREMVYSVDDALDELLLDAIYQYTCTTATSTWGAYVTLDQIRHYWDDPQQPSSALCCPGTNDNEQMMDHEYSRDYEHQLAVQIAAGFLQQTLRATGSQDCEDSHDDSTNRTNTTRWYPPEAAAASSSPRPCVSLWNTRDCQEAHGVAVWGLASHVQSHVPYHMDYAELIRYETGVIVPPVLAGTIHCSRLQTSTKCSTNNSSRCTAPSVGDNDSTGNAQSDESQTNGAVTNHCRCHGVIVGGDYVVRAGGSGSSDAAADSTAAPSSHRIDAVLDHYKTHGYKSIISSGAAWKDSHDTNNTCTNSTCSNVDNQKDWIRIPYRFNRLICQSGHLPHLSTRVHSITTAPESSTMTTTTATRTIPMRVIVGLNVFLLDVGPTVQAAPEHSPAFRERVRRATTRAPKSQITLATVLANPRLRRALVQAKRAQDHRDHASGLAMLDDRIRQFLLQARDSSSPTSLVRIEHVLKACSAEMNGQRHGSMAGPSAASDVYWRIHQLWQSNELTCARRPVNCALPGTNDFYDSFQLEVIPPSTQSNRLPPTDWYVGLANLSEGRQITIGAANATEVPL